MKTISTVIASLLLSISLLVSPAHADEPSPPTPPLSCSDLEDIANQWRDRALAAEADRDRFYTKMVIAQTNLTYALTAVREEQATSRVLRTELERARTWARRAEAKAQRRLDRAERRAETIAELRAKIRDLQGR